MEENSTRSDVIIVNLQVEGVSNSTQLPAILDTGFSGVLMMPDSTALSTGMKYCYKEKLKIANGEEFEANVYVTKIIFNDRELYTLIYGGSDKVPPLVGIEFLNKFNLKLVILTAEVSPSKKNS